MAVEKLNPKALAASGDDELDSQPGVQHVSVVMIFVYVTSTNELPAHSAWPFAEWLDGVWYDFNEDGDLTNQMVIASALADWRGGA